VQLMYLVWDAWILSCGYRNFAEIIYVGHCPISIALAPALSLLGQNS
jgi:hypothetical protein